MSKTYPIIERMADDVIVTARSTVEAQQAAIDAMGGDCTIVSVERVREGGIGGFFTTELVRCVATPSRFLRADRELDAAMTSAEDLVSSLRSSSPQFADRLMDELLQHRPTPSPATPASPVEMLLAEVLSPAIHAQPAAPLPVVELSPSPHRCDPEPAAEPTSSGHSRHIDRMPAILPARSAAPADPRWSHQALRALGLPDRIVDLAMLQRPHEGPQWIMALMSAFRTICAQPPAGPTVLVGPSCANLARQLRLVSVGPEELSESLSSVAIPNVSANVARTALNDRYLHLMVGGSWQHLGSVRPHVVSAATAADVIDAVRVCCAWDATLGWTQVGDKYERLDEFTLVAHVRSILYGIDRPVGDSLTGDSATATSMMSTFP